MNVGHVKKLIDQPKCMDVGQVAEFLERYPKYFGVGNWEYQSFDELPKFTVPSLEQGRKAFTTTR